MTHCLPTLGNFTILAVGYYRKDTDPADTRRGFVYDHGTGTFNDINDLLSLGNAWERTPCFSVNRNGIVVGYVRETGGLNRPVWFDFLDAIPTLRFLEDDFPEVNPDTTGINRYCVDVNSNGDMLIGSTQDGSLVSENFLVNPFTLEAAEFDGFSANAVNNSRVVVGRLVIPFEPQAAVRYDVATSTMSVFPQYASGGANDINNADQFCGVWDVNIRRNRTKRYSFIHQGSNSNVDPIWSSEPFETIFATSLNDDGDATGRSATDSGETFYIYHSTLGQVFGLGDLVNDDFFNNLQAGWSHPKILGRDQSLLTPSPIVVGASSEQSNHEHRLIFLFPEDTP